VLDSPDRRPAPAISGIVRHPPGTGAPRHMVPERCRLCPLVRKRSTVVDGHAYALTWTPTSMARPGYVRDVNTDEVDQRGQCPRNVSIKRVLARDSAPVIRDVFLRTPRQPGASRA
jgi:hypothetical protein